MIAIIDFGSQTTHLIARRLRELGAETHIVEPEKALSYIKNHGVAGIILSGGPSSVYEKNAPSIGREIFALKIPVLGICYGEQLMTQLLGGTVKPGRKKEYGPARITVRKNPLFNSIPTDTFSVWMSHGDEVRKVPNGFVSIGITDTIAHAAIAHPKKKMFGIQFHPEVVHTQFGETILSNFIRICGITPHRQSLNKEFVANLIDDVKESIPSGRVISAHSGGVDSSVANILVHRAIGDRLIPIYIDTGLMRKNETNQLEKIFKKHFRMEIKVIHAQKQFLTALKGITDPEKKRKIIGKTFIDVFEKEAKKYRAQFFVQGTIYPDVIESKGTKHSKNIKSHHNVGGLPARMKLTLVEPLRTFYKDEVRKIGKLVGLPDEIIHRQPFPGPGFAVRIIGEVTEKKLAILRLADAIVREEVHTAGLNNSIWQAFAVFTGIKTTGVRGDLRAYGDTVAVRLIEATDTMSAHWARVPHSLLEKISTRIVTEVPQVNRVVYDITTKPPATMEWE